VAAIGGVPPVFSATYPRRHGDKRVAARLLACNAGLPVSGLRAVGICPALRLLRQPPDQPNSRAATRSH
jgi:hypothetical protein